MARRRFTLEYIQRRWRDIKLRLSPPLLVTLNLITVLRPGATHLPITTPIALGWTLHGLDQ